MARHFLYLTNTRLVSLLTAGGRIASRAEFEVSGPGAEAFEARLAAHAKVPVHLFTDLTEEDFRLDTIPHVGGRDRDAILARKLGQIFRNTPFRFAVAQGREMEGRRDDRVLYTAIPNAEVLRPWLEPIDRLRVPLAGIHSAAVFSATLLDELDLVFHHTLLVTFTPGGAMRQTYFRDREIKFSRLTPIDPEEGQSLGTLISEETTRTWQYLDSLRHFGDDDRLEVCVLLHASDRPLVQPALRDFAQIQHRILEMDQVSARLGLKPAPRTSTAEEIFVHLFLKRGGENHFASAEMRRYESLRKARVALNAASLAVLLAAVGWGGWNVSRIFHGSKADTRVAQELGEVTREYESITRALPSFGVGGSTMRDTVSFYNATIRDYPTVTRFAVQLSQVLGRHPDVRLTLLAWEATQDAAAVPRVRQITPATRAPVRSIAKAPAPRAAPEAEPTFGGGRYEVALLEGTVHAANNDFRGAIEEVERLAADIGKLEGFRAEVVASPLDLRPSAAIEGKHSEREAASMDLGFSLRVVHDRSRSA